MPKIEVQTLKKSSEVHRDKCSINKSATHGQQGGMKCSRTLELQRVCDAINNTATLILKDTLETVKKTNHSNSPCGKQNNQHSTHKSTKPMLSFFPLSEVFMHCLTKRHHCLTIHYARPYYPFWLLHVMKCKFCLTAK